MGERTLLAGLWARMGVASVLWTVGVGVLLAAEIALAAGLTVLVLYTAPVWILVSLCLAALCLGFSVLGGLTATVASVAISPGALSDSLGDSGIGAATERVGTVLWAPPWRQCLAAGCLFACSAGALVLAHTVGVEMAGLSPLSLGFAVGTALVGTHLFYLLQTELGHTAGTVRREIEANYDIVETSQRQAELENRVRRLAQQADVPSPAIRVGSSAVPQAATVGYRPEHSVVVVSQGLLDTLDSRQLDAVLAHELAHLGNRDGAVVTALSVPATKARQLLGWVTRPGSNDGVLLVLGVALPVYVASRLSVIVVARYREYVADYTAVCLTGEPAALASALETLDDACTERPEDDLRHSQSTAAFGIVPPPWDDRPFLDGPRRLVCRRLLGTHPPTATRIERLQTYDTA